MRAQKRNALAVSAAAVLLSLPATATWQERASSYDVGRLAKLGEARAKGLAEAQSGRDIGLVRAVLDAEQAKGEPPHSYSGNGASAVAMTTPDDAVGLLMATGRATARLELPFPGPESPFDIIQTRR